MPPDWKQQIQEHDAIFFGAVGWPARVPDHISLWGLLITLRREFDQYVNLRPVRLFRGVPSPLASRELSDIDFAPAGLGPTETARLGAFCPADERFAAPCNLTFEIHDENGRILKQSNATIRPGASAFLDYDILCAHFVQHPDWFDVVVGSNLFGDILSDLGPACTGTIGIAPSANLNPEREFPSLFEPVHGSAPDIYGKGIANPIGQIWSGAMMLEHLGHSDAAVAVMRAIESVLAEGPRTPDMGGKARTIDVGKAVASAITS